MTRLSPWRRISKLPSIVIGMSGLRLDRLRLDALSIVWLVVWLVSTLAPPVLFRWLGFGSTEAIVYLAVAFAVYYGGLTVVLGLGGRRWLLRKYGPQRSVRWFEAALGIAFAHQAVSQGVIADVTPNTLGLGLPVALTTGLGIAALIVGLGVKIWSTQIVGLDVYYYRDMYVQQGGHTSDESETFVVHGPYRWLSNPMYGVGNLSAYGLALYERSWLALVAAVVAQVCIYLFYFRYERPFVQRYYLAGDADSQSRAA